jgi:magnesium transporter
MISPRAAGSDADGISDRGAPSLGATPPDRRTEVAAGGNGDAPGRKRKARVRGKGLQLPRGFEHVKPGSAPGVDLEELSSAPVKPGAARVTCIDYCPEDVRFEEVTDLPRFMNDHRPEWAAVRWINVDGLSDLAVISAFAEKYRLHPLAVEDVLNVPQRPKVEAYEAEGPFQARLFIVARMMELVDNHIQAEQISILVGHETVLTFQESPGDVWDPVRTRLRARGSQLRRADASFLAYTLIDAIVDHIFPILEQFGDRLETLEDEVLARPGPDTIQEIHRIKRELLLVRRAMWPMREVLQRLHREPHECFSEITRTYVRDVYEHAVQVIDIVETYRELATGLTETYMTAMSNRMNEIVKVLTIIGTIFIPLTFLAGVYGMNFQHLPELEWRWGYALFWAVSAVIAGGMIAWFHTRGWL